MIRENFLATMQISVETTSGLERRLTIVVPSQDFEGQITAKLAEARERINLPGYRRGKVPLKEVRRRLGSAVRHEVAGELMQQSFIEAVGAEEITPAGSPSLEVVKMDPGIDF
ncbi:MAG: trigger factor family protein, partial [Proteobacteria bacterium]|nr:trigger factor family protein [Pseudomonadota bacterium]